VLYVLGSLVGGGAERTAVNVARHIDDDAVALTLGLLNATGDYVGEVDEGMILPMPAPLPRLFGVLPRRGFGTLSAAWAILRAVRRCEPHVVVSSVSAMNQATWLAMRVCGRRRPRWIVREGNNPEATVAHGGKRLWFQRVYRDADHVLAISCGIADQLADRFGVPRDRLTVIYNPLDLQRIGRCALEAPPVDLPARFIVGVGRLHPAKGFDVLIRAFDVIRKTVDVDLVILGNGSLEGELRGLAARLGVADRVHFLGFSANPWAIMSRAEVFCLSSNYEGFGHVVAEALACRTPVVSTDCDFGPSEILQDGGCGVLAPVGDAAALGSVLLQVLRREVDVEAMRDRGVRRAEDFRADVVARRYQELFCRLANAE